MNDELYATISSSIYNRFALVHHGDGVSGCEKYAIDSGERIREGFGLVEIEQHSVFTIAPPGLRLRQFAGRVDNPNGIDPFELGDYFTPNTACRAQNQDSRSACSLFFN